MTPDQVTQLLHAARDGDANAPSQAWQALQAEIRRLAGESRDDRTVGDSILIDAAYRDLFGGTVPDWSDRAEFLDAVARSMGDFLRRRHAERTQAGEHLRHDLTGTAGELTEFTSADSDEGIRAIDIVDEIARDSPDTGRVTRLRFVLGLDNETVARNLRMDPKTAEMKWRFGQAMIRRGLSRGLNE